ncbi:MAG TPA: PIN domain-containing protein [Thermodesulfobacteriota bacterium]|nr:PIN domain-containing protein [Thermodesulfobacteriota bacterium]
MPNKIFVDTSFVIALVNRNDQYHEAAIRLSHNLESAALLTSSGVLLEIGNGLAKRYRDSAIEIIDLFLSADNIEIIAIDEKLFIAGLMNYKKYSDKNWGLVDCISFAIMREHGIEEVLTFDYDFEQAGFTVLHD